MAGVFQIGVHLRLEEIVGWKMIKTKRARASLDGKRERMVRSRDPTREGMSAVTLEQEAPSAMVRVTVTRQTMMVVRSKNAPALRQNPVTIVGQERSGKDVPAQMDGRQS